MYVLLVLHFLYTELVVKKMPPSTKEVMFCALLLAEGKCRDLTCNTKAELVCHTKSD